MFMDFLNLPGFQDWSQATQKNAVDCTKMIAIARKHRKCVNGTFLVSLVLFGDEILCGCARTSDFSKTRKTPKLLGNPWKSMKNP